MFIITILLGILGMIATDIFVPSLPSISNTFQQSLGHTELTISLFLVGFAFSQLLYGPISDRTGRKAPLVFGVLLFMLGSLICVLASSFMAFCVGRIIQGLAVGSGLSLARVILRDTYNGTALAVKSAQMAIFISLTPAVAPFIGGLLQNAFGFRAVFVFMFAYGLLLLILLLFFFKETIRHKEHSLNLARAFSHYGQLLRNFRFMHYVLIAGIAFSALILYANVIPFIIQNQLHLSAKINGEILLLAALGTSTGGYISSKIVRQVTSRKLLFLGLICLTSSGVLLILTEILFGTSLRTLIPLIFLLTLACGFIFPNAVSSAFSEVQSHIGTAGALYGCIQISTAMTVSFLVNLIPHQGQIVLGLFYLVLGGAGLVFLAVPLTRSLLKSTEIAT